MSARPFYFVLVVWGREYRDYFLEYCLPSLLSPRNIPVLDGQRPAKFLFATTAEDWAAIRGTAIFRALERHVEPVYLELPSQGDRPYWSHAVEGHKICCDRVIRDEAYRIFIGPDALYSDGAVACLHNAALDGAEVVLAFVPLLAKTDAFFRALDRMGLRPAKSARDTGIPITVTGRQTAALAIEAMHGFSKVNEWESPEFGGYASTPWWRIPGRQALVACGLRWDLYLVDYKAAHHDDAALNPRGFDGDYIARAVGHLETIYFVRDSDDFSVAGWNSTPEPAPRLRPLRPFAKGAGFRASAYGPAFNAMQRALLFLPTVVHGESLDSQAVAAVEDEALRTMVTWLDPPADVERYSRGLPPHRRNFAGLNARIAACRLPLWRRSALASALIRSGRLFQAAHLLSWPWRAMRRLFPMPMIDANSRDDARS